MKFLDLPLAVFGAGRSWPRMAAVVWLKIFKTKIVTLWYVTKKLLPIRHPIGKEPELPIAHLLCRYHCYGTNPFN